MSSINVRVSVGAFYFLEKSQLFSGDKLNELFLSSLKQTLHCPYFSVDSAHHDTWWYFVLGISSESFLYAFTFYREIKDQNNQNFILSCIPVVKIRIIALPGPLSPRIGKFNKVWIILMSSFKLSSVKL